LSPCDTPGAAIRQLTDAGSSPDGLSCAGAEAAWRAVTPLLAGTPHVRISRDGGRTYPARHARPLPAGPPGQPCTVPVYDPGTGTGRMLALDLDPARGRGGGAGPAGQVSAQADAIVRLVARLGGRCVTDVAPGGGRHVYVLFAAPLPWRELRDLARAIAVRFPAVDVAPVSSLGGQISPPGSRHKSGGWRALAGPLQDARAAVERPNGPEVWNGLLAEFAAELRRGSGAAEPDVAELDDTGVLWLPRLGGHAPLGAELDHTARTGRWDRSRHAGRSEARMAVLAAAAARGWQLADVRTAVTSGAWGGLCKIWGGPSTMDEALGQIFKYLVWRDTKAAVLLLIRNKDVTAVIKKAVAKIEAHPNYKRRGPSHTDDRLDFVMHAQDDAEREIHLALLPFALRTTTNAATA
jgi:hypothetical protein